MFGANPALRRGFLPATAKTANLAAEPESATYRRRRSVLHYWSVNYAPLCKMMMLRRADTSNPRLTGLDSCYSGWNENKVCPRFLLQMLNLSPEKNRRHSQSCKISLTESRCQTLFFPHAVSWVVLTSRRARTLTRNSSFRIAPSSMRDL